MPRQDTPIPEMPTQDTPTHEAILRQLTGPGAPFEIETSPVHGRPMRNWKQRERSLREKIQNAARHGEREFLVQGPRRIRYDEFARLCWGTARALQDEHGLQKGDRLSVLAYNSPDWLIALFGAVSAGGIGVGLNGWWAGEEIEYGLRDSGSRYLVVDERLFPRCASLLDRLPDLEKVFFIGSHIGSSGSAAPAGTIPIEALIQAHEDPPTTPIDEDDPFVILYTSGTTGRPKGCITTHRGTIAQVQGILLAGVAGAMASGGAGAASDGDDRPTAASQPAAPTPHAAPTPPTALITSPLFHVGGLHSSFCTQLTAGGKIVFNEGRFDPEQVMALIERERITNWGAIPTMLHRVVHHEKIGDYDLRSLKAISFGGAPTPPETIDRAREVLPIEPSFTNVYGLTETHGVATSNGGRSYLDKRASVGRPMPLLDMKVVDEAGRELPTGETGELVVFGPLVTPGYWNRPEATAESVREGWLHTGDLGHRDEEGFFWVSDRAKDMILRGGENVYCTEIENVLADHPEIDEAAILGVPDPELGERVKAVVVRTPGSALAVAEVQKHVAARMARFKVPEIVEFRSRPLPRNPAGKILKNLLRGEQGGTSFHAEDLEPA